MFLFLKFQDYFGCTFLDHNHTASPLSTIKFCFCRKMTITTRFSSSDLIGSWLRFIWNMNPPIGSGHNLFYNSRNICGHISTISTIDNYGIKYPKKSFLIQCIDVPSLWRNLQSTYHDHAINQPSMHVNICCVIGKLDNSGLATLFSYMKDFNHLVPD